MKTTGFIFLLTQLFFLQIVENIAQAQLIENIKPLIGKDIIFSSVKNGFTYELRLTEKTDLSTFLGVSARVTNTGDDVFRLEGWLNTNKWVGSGIYLEPGESKTLQIFIMRPREKGLTIFQGMKGLPGGTVSFSPINPESVDRISFIIYTNESASLSISPIKPYGTFISPQKISGMSGFYPFIDKYGQYKHGDWPGKTNSDKEFEEAINNEEENLLTFPGPSGRNRFGGWADGPRLKATANFRTEKVDGKWWLVDPEGSLFWSHGLTCVRFDDGNTRISGREEFFDNLPGFTDPLGVFYSKNRNDTIFNYSHANLFRKYGFKWKEKATENVVKRLKSWGINSYGNWSDPEIYLYPENRIPYTVALSSGRSQSDRESIRFPNVFDPGFRESVKTAIKNLDKRIINDQYCIGFFIDNELNVNDLTQQVMLQPVNSKTRSKFLETLKRRYSSIEKLNNSWKTSYKSMVQIDSISKLPEGSIEDKQSFALEIMDMYYRICREELKLAVPDKLYFGSRLHCHYFPDDQSESQIIKIASQYCDVVCFNRYRFSTEDLILPFGIDKPTIIGEFHFGALDRGLCYAGMRTVADQYQRAEAYYHYVEGALHNPQVVGTHWFQYSDMAYTGRFDGANAQVGFVDICDNPYPEIISVSRKIGYQMYKLRFKKSY